MPATAIDRAGGRVAIWVKICGLASEEAVRAAADAGADAIGFVFAPSRRQVSAERAAQLSKALGSHPVRRVAVLLHPAQALVDEVCEVVRPDALQTDAEDLLSLQLPEGLAVIPVMRAAPPRGALPSRVLFEGPVSGAGASADWSVAAEWARRTELVLAGGLNGENVAQAIQAVAPFGVDVSSGVESAPGIKDARKIHEFVRRARAAAAGASV